MKQYIYYGFLVICGVLLLNSDQIFSEDTPPTTTQATDAAATALFKKVDPGVVMIQHETAGGSGFIISPEGYIITNNHVIMGNIQEEGDPQAVAKRITVILHNKKKYKAQVVGHSLEPDVALIKIEPQEELTIVSLGDSELVKTGQRAYVVGSAMGLERGLTAGVISNPAQADFPTVTKVIQTDAPINPGNSGGPLFNEQGEVIGITTFKMGWGSEGMGFALPINVAKVLKEYFLKYGYFKRADLPFFMTDTLYDELARVMGVEKGVFVAFVEPDSLAYKCGLRDGDVIIEFNDQPVSARTDAENRDFNWSIITHPIGTPVKFKVLRSKDNKSEEIAITGNLVEDEPLADIGYELGEIKEIRYEALGLGVKRLTMMTHYYHNLPRIAGIRVTNVWANSPTSKAGLFTNDIITTLDQTPITGDEQFQKELESRLAQHNKHILLTIRRGNGYLKTALKPYYDLANKKVALILPEKDSEYFELIKRILIENGAEVTVVSKGREASVSKDQTIKPDFTLAELKITDYHGIIFVGGPGAQTYWQDETVYQMVRNAVKEQKTIGAIGAASIILINAEPAILEKKLTTDQDYSEIALAKKANYTGKKVEHDGNIVTTTGFDAEAIKSFLKEFKTALRNKSE